MGKSGEFIVDHSDQTDIGVLRAAAAAELNHPFNALEVFSRRWMSTLRVRFL